MDTTEPPNVDVHPRKRKLKTKENATAGSSSSSTSGDIAGDAGGAAGTAGAQGQNQSEPVLNCYEMYMNIRKQVNSKKEKRLKM